MAVKQTHDRAREEIFASIRRNLTASETFDAAYEAQHARHENGHGSSALLEVAAETVTALENFRRALTAVGGNFYLVANVTKAAALVRELVAQKNARRVAISDVALVASVIENANLNSEILTAATKAEMFGCDVGVTSAQLAIAETGTLVLLSDAERHRLASLVPPVHICLLAAQNIRQTLGEVLRELNANGADALSRTITFVTGASRTSDIELTLAIGVHGPGELHVIVIEEEGSKSKLKPKT